jgi:hypothetical protein
MCTNARGQIRAWFLLCKAIKQVIIITVHVKKLMSMKIWENIKFKCWLLEINYHFHAVFTVPWNASLKIHL